jgi:hypothetical protein
MSIFFYALLRCTSERKGIHVSSGRLLQFISIRPKVYFSLANSENCRVLHRIPPLKSVWNLRILVRCYTNMYHLGISQNSHKSERFMELNYNIRQSRRNVFRICQLVLTSSMNSCTPNCVQTAISRQYCSYLGSGLTPGIVIIVTLNSESSVALNFRLANQMC